MTKLYIPADVYHEAVKGSLIAPSPTSLIFGHSEVVFQPTNQLIDLDNKTIRYFQLPAAILVDSSNKLVLAQMQADKNMPCIPIKLEDLTILEYSFYSTKYQNTPK